MFRYLFMLSLLLAGNIHGQDCTGGRYLQPIFSSVVKTSAVPFGSNVGITGTDQILYMDVYEPEGDLLASRPAIIVAFGGSFVSGQRSDVELLCRELAKRGHVAIAPDYRVGNFPIDAFNTMQAVMRSAHDLKACIRYVRRSVAELGDPYGIDTSRILVGGVSAGAIGALHATYLDQESEMPSVLDPIVEQIGGVEGNSGNDGHSSSVIGCFSLSGAIADTSWIEVGDPPLVSVHETGDLVVPYFTEPVYILGAPTGLLASGSHDIHERMEHVGIDHCLLTYEANSHVGYLLSDPFTVLDLIYSFTASVVCGDDPYCGMIVAAIDENEDPVVVRIFPDPVTSIANVQSEVSITIHIHDLQGRAIGTYELASGTMALDLSDLPSGPYFIRSEQGFLARFLKIQD
jgi:acetyl esterase/lipase